MKKIFEYPQDGIWKSESKFKAKYLALEIFNHSVRLGINPNIVNPSNPFVVGWDKTIQYTGVYIQLKNQDYGCTAFICITDKEKHERQFQELWKRLVDDDLFVGGPYIKGLRNMTKAERQRIVKKLVSSGKQYTLTQLADRTLSSVSTIQRDLDELGLKTPTKNKR